MAQRLTRRTFLVSAALAALPVPAFAQAKPVRIGLLTVKTEPLATGGIQMEQGTIRFLKDRNYTLAGRKVELVVGDTGGNPAGTKTKTQELVERHNVDMILGPLAAFELLAISDYAAQAKMPILSLAAAEDMTQRKPNPYFVRASGTSAQYLHPLADYAAKELKFKNVITIADDFAFGHEQMGGFQRVFEDAGGRVVKKLWPPLVTPDYTPYLAQISGVDAVVQGFAGSNPLKFMKQYKDQGLKLPVLAGAWAVPLRPLRQRRRGLLPPSLREEGRQARQHDDQDVSEREPVLDVRREVVPLPAGVLARLSAAEILRGPRRPPPSSA